MIKLSVNKPNGLVYQPEPALLFFRFSFEYLISGPKSYRARSIQPKFGSKTQWIGSVQPEKFEKNWSTFEVDHFSRLDRSEFWLNGCAHRDFGKTGLRIGNPEAKISRIPESEFPYMGRKQGHSYLFARYARTYVKN